MTYNKDQPREPAGSKTGGQWVKTPGGGRREAQAWTQWRRGRGRKQWVPGHIDEAGVWHPGYDVQLPPEGTEAEQLAREERARVIEQARIDDERRKAEELARFKQGKREAAARFAAKEREAHEAGLRGPATLRKQLRSLERDNPDMASFEFGSREGVWERQKGKWVKVMRMTGQRKWRKGQVMEWVEKLGGGGHEWVKVRKTGELNTEGNRRWERAPGGGHTWAQVKGPATLAREKQDRVRADYVAKEAQWFKRGKNIAAKRFAAKKRGDAFDTPADPVFGEVSPGGAFKWRHARNARGKPLQKPGGGAKGRWRRIATEKRAGAQVRAGAFPVHPAVGGPPGEGVQQRLDRLKLEGIERRNREIAEAVERKRAEQAALPKQFQDAVGPSQLQPMKTADGRRVHRSDSGQEAWELTEQGGHGIFDSMKVQIVGDGKGIMKTDGIGGNFGRSEIGGIRRGFAHRELAADKVDEMLGLDMVPRTTEFVSRGQPLDPAQGPFHSLQELVPHAMNGEEWNARDVYQKLEDKQEVSRMLMLDTLLGNRDRHGQNWLVSTTLDKNGQHENFHVHAIDHGLTIVDTVSNAIDMKERWRSRLADGIPRGEKYPLDPKYRDRLQRAIDDGSLRAVFEAVEFHTLTTRSTNAHAITTAAMSRASSLVSHWSDIFKDEVEKPRQR